jgi:predicted DNA-binding transcriptional regulator AlpA
MSDESMMRAEEVARFLNTSVRTLDGWRRQGVGPPWVKLSQRAVRYEARALADWVATRSPANAGLDPARDNGR